MKPALFCCVGAFVVSFLLGLLSGSNIGIIFLKALVFAGAFFGIGFGLNYLLDNMLLGSGSSVDITVGDEQSEDALLRKESKFGAEFFMSDEELGLTGAPANEGGGRPQTASPPLDNIPPFYDDAGAASPGEGGGAFMPAAGGGLEQNNQRGYTEVGNVVNLAGAAAKNQTTAPKAGFSDFSAFVPGIPGMQEVSATGVDDAFAGLNVDGGSLEDVRGVSGGLGGITEGTVELSLEKPKSENDFSGQDGKKMASAIQTLLKKDNE